MTNPLSRIRMALAALVASVVAFIVVPAAPTYASEPIQDFVVHQTTFYYGGVARSAVVGDIVAWRYSSTQDKFTYDLRVYDHSADGYRGRTWVNVYEGCFCALAANRFSARVFDAAGGAGTSTLHQGVEITWPNAIGVNTYTIEVKVGRYDADTGAHDTNPAQNQYFYITLD